MSQIKNRKWKIPSFQNPKAFFQHFTSEFSVKTSSVHPWRTTSKRSSQQSPTTPTRAARMFGEDTHTDHYRHQTDLDALIPNIIIPTLPRPNHLCRNETTGYHSFPSIERRPCQCCGWRTPLSSTSQSPTVSRPCHECRSKKPLSSPSFRRRESHFERKRERLVQSSLPFERESATYLDEGPRPVSEAAAAKRIGNPPRRVTVPISHSPVLNEAGLATRAAQQYRARLTYDKEHDLERPKSPKLHHIHVLPNANTYPYAHKSEMNQHLAALRAETQISQGHSTDRTNIADVPGRLADFSETVFYGRPVSSVLSDRQVEPLVARNSRVNNRDAFQKRYSRLHDSEQTNFEESHLIKDANPLTEYHEAMSGSIETMDTLIDDDRYSEFEGSASRDNEEPRLRGGGRGREIFTESFRFKLKKWLLTGSWKSHSNDPDSDVDMPSARTPNIASVARTNRSRNWSVPLPTSISKVIGGNPMAYCSSPFLQQGNGIA